MFVDKLCLFTGGFVMSILKTVFKFFCSKRKRAESKQEDILERIQARVSRPGVGYSTARGCKTETEAIFEKLCDIYDGVYEKSTYDVAIDILRARSTSTLEKFTEECRTRKIRNEQRAAMHMESWSSSSSASSSSHSMDGFNDNEAGAEHRGYEEVVRVNNMVYDWIENEIDRIQKERKAQ
jgi:hypothetical protein